MLARMCITQPVAGIHKVWEKVKMNDLMLKMYVNLQSLMAREEGQDLVEYALVVALIAFGAVAAMKGLSTEINTAFADISSELNSALT
jgi:pilus assembly protein Flp/PilA